MFLILFSYFLIMMKTIKIALCVFKTKNSTKYIHINFLTDDTSFQMLKLHWVVPILPISFDNFKYKLDNII